MFVIPSIGKSLPLKHPRFITSFGFCDLCIPYIPKFLVNNEIFYDFTKNYAEFDENYTEAFSTENTFTEVFSNETFGT